MRTQYGLDALTQIHNTEDTLALSESSWQTSGEGNINGDLKSCRDICLGKLLHARSLENQNDLSIYVVNALTNMYGRCGSMKDARTLFDSIYHPDVVQWNTLLLGYGQNGDPHVALDIFTRMKEQGYTADCFTYVAALKACTSIALEGDESHCLERGRKIHAEIGCHMNRYLQNTLIDMYSKCGSMDEAHNVFEQMRKPDLVSWNALLLGYVENGEGQVTMDLWTKMKKSGVQPSPVTYIAVLKACTSLGFLEVGREIHSEICYRLNFYLENALMDMYCKCGSMVEARRVFDGIKKPNVVHWSTLLLGYAENGEAYIALDLFSKMKERGYSPDTFTYVAVLKACTSLAENQRESAKKRCLELGKALHSEIGYCFKNLNFYIQNTLIDMYSKCGSMVDSQRVFDKMKKPDFVSWNSLMMGYAENNEGHMALVLFSRMKHAGFTPTYVTYIAAVKACSSLAINADVHGKEGYLKLGRDIHSEIDSNSKEPFLKSTLIDMYSKCGSISEAHQVFDSIDNPNVVAWNTLLMGYAENGAGEISLDLFNKMTAAPNSLTYIATLKACGSVGALALGRKLHREITEFTPQIVTSLVDFYAKCGSVVEARQVFDFHPKTRDVTTWTALLGGYGKFGDSDSVFSLFKAMKEEGLHPDVVTFSCLLLCCSHAGLVEKATENFEAMAGQYGLTPSVIHYTCMVDVLGRGKKLSEAIGAIQKMPCKPSVAIWMTLLGACRKWKNVEIGRAAFQALTDMDGMDSSPYVLMASIFGSTGMLQEQRRVLQKRLELAKTGTLEARLLTKQLK